jgi:hypothetical protein
MGLPVRYGNPRDVFAASSSFVHLSTLRTEEKKRKEKKRTEKDRKGQQWRCWQTQLYINREVYSGSGL